MRKTIVITGGSDGIGAAAARKLVAGGHRVVIVGRSLGKTKDLAAELDIPFYVADFADLAQVQRLASTLLESYPVINVLANNAGGIMGPRVITVDGYEKTFQVNHLAPFLLTRLLMPALVAGSATVIQTASVAARVFARLDLDDLQNAVGYAPQKAYGNAKLANILFTQELQHRFGARGVTAVAFHPGIVASNFASDTTHFMRRVYHGPLKLLFTVTPEQGADQLIWLAQGTPNESFLPGAYYETRRIATKVNPQMHVPRIATQLWTKSELLLKGF
ncbi:SDR family NAD(P)-dependent oxidoreductase [Glutamicibacter sp.]|jgi:Short-chain dehydrogenases of various substrate specificities|uniref:SDR family NAD(P)-dependent oxidoreductase n=1 Tax=Glutamicibacter sp. TaxID=1931995 RepID=UPI002B496543|nr:SDR family NAD(P)-dependent oxidoreductase [Glutamicibacter sp.]HJX79530.1 SDR family NAD(P)-dependent oxidoreductase [Glutamicibacter sp.]